MNNSEWYNLRKNKIFSGGETDANRFYFHVTETT